VARDVGCFGVEGLAFQQDLQLGLGLAADTRLFLLQALGLDAVVLFLLRTDRIRLGEIDILARARLARRALRRAGAGRTALARWTAITVTRGPLALAGLAAGRAPCGLPAGRPSRRASGRRSGLRSLVRSGLGAALKPRPSSWSRRVSLMTSDQ